MRGIAEFGAKLRRLMRPMTLARTSVKTEISRKESAALC